MELIIVCVIVEFIALISFCVAGYFKIKKLAESNENILADTDAFETGSALGIRGNLCKGFVADSKGIACLCADVASFATGIRNRNK